MRASRYLAGLFAGLCGFCLSAVAAPIPAPASVVFPPWQGHANDPVQERGLEFSVAEVDNLPDFHGDPIDPGLSIFVGGNYFFAMAPLVAAFTELHPDLRGRVYYETLPPGRLLQQIRKGGRITVGNMSWIVHADVYAAGLKKVQAAVDEGVLQAPVQPYASNTLTLMVPAGNPANVTGLHDLARPGLRVLLPNPHWEGVARQIRQSLEHAGGRALAHSVYDDKVCAGEAMLTEIHHRQTPMLLMQGRADVGVTWRSEALFQESIGHPLRHIDIPEADNVRATYAAAVVHGAPHPAAARAWIEFLASAPAQQILARYGFGPALSQPPAGSSAPSPVGQGGH